jgi:hypothetical protein
MFFKDVRGIFALRSQNLKKQALGTLEGLVKLVKQKNKPMLQNQQKNSTESTQTQISPESFWKLHITSADH